jgi:hypothetical protein
MGASADQSNCGFSLQGTCTRIITSYFTREAYGMKHTSRQAAGRGVLWASRLVRRWRTLVGWGLAP